MMSKFVEKCEICRKMMSNLRKMRNLSKNDVEICLTGEICRKILSKSRKMMSKSIEMAKFVEICRIMSKFIE